MTTFTIVTFIISLASLAIVLILYYLSEKEYRKTTKILKHGIDLSLDVECTCCGAKFKVQPGEVHHKRNPLYNVPPEERICYGGTQKPVSFYEYSYVICPDCKMEVDVSKLF